MDETHDPGLKSWVESANEAKTEFPIQNLPFGRFHSRVSRDEPRIGVAIGDLVLDLAAAGLIEKQGIEALMVLRKEDRSQLRHSISRFLSDAENRSKAHRCLVAQNAIEMCMPCEIGDFTDFYTSIHHATTVGKQFRPNDPLLPNYKWLPIGYHGRSSSIGVSGESFRRPCGQVKAPSETGPQLSASSRLDYELEIGIVIGNPNAKGVPVAIEDAEQCVFGFVLLNDWSARDLQSWEYQPLGPFLSKNFASTISPWIVTTEALEPFRIPFYRPATDPSPLPYLDSVSNRLFGALDVQLEVWLQTSAMREAGDVGERISASNFSDAYWTVAQLIAHHTVNGCNLRSGDLLGTGTLSGPHESQAGSLLELTRGGHQEFILQNGESRRFLADGDTIILRGHCERVGARRIGFGECRGTVMPAR